MSTVLSDIERMSGELVQAKHGDEWVAIQISEGRPPTVIMPITTLDPGYEEWKQEVRSFLVVSRKPEHKHISYPEPPQNFPLPKNWEPIPLRTHCVFWFRGRYIVLDAVELFTLSLQGPVIPEILRRLKEEE